MYSSPVRIRRYGCQSCLELQTHKAEILLENLTRTSKAEFSYQLQIPTKSHNLVTY